MNEKTKLKKVKAVGFKRIKAVEVELAESGLTVLGGKNRQGKTSLQDAIKWCLGGDKFKPTSPRNDDAEKTEIHIIFTDETKASRKGKALSLTAVDADGRKLTQTHLNKKVSPLALNLSEFMTAKPKDKATILLQCLGIGDELTAIDKRIADMENDRLVLGRDKVAKEKYAQELPYHDDAPDSEIIVSDLLEQQSVILAKNRSNQWRRDEFARSLQLESRIADEVEQLKKTLEEKQKDLKSIHADNKAAKKQIDALVDGDVSEINFKISSAQTENEKITENRRKQEAQKEADKLVAEYQSMAEMIQKARNERVSLLDGAKMPLEGLDVNDGSLTYNGKEWDCMSDSERIQVSVAIARSFAPDCGFVNLGDVEALDIDTQGELNAWCESNDFQIFAVRVSTHPEECTFMIEDGELKS